MQYTIVLFRIDHLDIKNTQYFRHELTTKRKLRCQHSIYLSAELILLRCLRDHCLIFAPTFLR